MKSEVKAKGKQLIFDVLLHNCQLVMTYSSGHRGTNIVYTVHMVIYYV